jgi:hypothetical protein
MTLAVAAAETALRKVRQVVHIFFRIHLQPNIRIHLQRNIACEGSKSIYKQASKC